METIQQNNSVIDGVNLRTDTKRITHGQCKVLITFNSYNEFIQALKRGTYCVAT